MTYMNLFYFILFKKKSQLQLSELEDVRYLSQPLLKKGMCLPIIVLLFQKDHLSIK